MADELIPPANNQRKDITGEKFGRLTAVRYAGTNKHRQSLWECLCECGGDATVPIGALRTGNTTSCGCYKSEVLRELGYVKIAAIHAAQVTHGMTGTKLYRTWKNMKKRCYNPRSPDYFYYGARGISMCAEWRDDAGAFINWALKNGYADTLEIDRRDNDGNYSPANCRWATRRQQLNNFSRNEHIEYAGQRMTYAEWERTLGFPESLISSRMAAGYTPEQAVTLPHHKKRPRKRVT